MIIYLVLVYVKIRHVLNMLSKFDSVIFEISLSPTQKMSFREKCIKKFKY